MSRTHIIMPLIPVLQRQSPSAIESARAQFASLLIDQFVKDPTEEMMDRIERVLWGRTFGPSSMNDSVR